jgi:hypothetical protein
VAISIERVVVREVKCFLCAYTLGEMLGPEGHQMFRRAPDCPPPATRQLHRLRCPRCVGPVYLDGAETTASWATFAASTTNRPN